MSERAFSEFDWITPADLELIERACPESQKEVVLEAARGLTAQFREKPPTDALHLLREYTNAEAMFYACMGTVACLQPGSDEFWGIYFTGFISMLITQHWVNQQAKAKEEVA